MSEKSNTTEKKQPTQFGRRLKYGVYTTIAGYLILVLGAKPSIFGLDRSPVIGFVQTAIFLVGLSIICIGACVAMMCFYPKNHVSIAADFGVRMVETGFVIALFTGMADVFGIGSHPLTGVPFFGPLQSMGVVLGEGVIAIGLVLMICLRSKAELEQEEILDYRNHSV